MFAFERHKFLPAQDLPAISEDHLADEKNVSARHLYVHSGCCFRKLGTVQTMMQMISTILVAMYTEEAQVTMFVMHLFLTLHCLFRTLLDVVRGY